VTAPRTSSIGGPARGVRGGAGEELLIVALEASADLHGAAVLRELQALRPGLRAFGAGGPRMRAAGFEALIRAEDHSVMGFAEVLPALPRILDAIDALRDAARDRRPAAALLIDSPDFNLRLARRLRELRIPIAYFIGPSVWAWRRYRVRQIARDVARMLVILPFEARFYAEHGVPAVYVGNPVADAQGGESFLPPRALTGVLALLPGSRPQEIRRIWPPMLAAARALRQSHPQLSLLVPVAPTIDRSLLGDVPDVELLDGHAPEVLARADAAIVASGTATLEAALALTPLVVDRGRDDTVFTSPRGKVVRVRNFRRVWLAACEAAGLDGLRVHDLRHTHAAILIAANRQLSAISRRLGHSSIAVTDALYGHIREEVDEGILDAIDLALAGVDDDAEPQGVLEPRQAAAEVAAEVAEELADELDAA